MRADLGDFQTPPALVAAVLKRLGPVAARWPRVLEPTCGRGNFLAGLLALDPPPAEIRGIELQADHLDAARRVISQAPESVRVDLAAGNLFDLDLRADALAWQQQGPLLVVGNPPWVTNSELGSLESGNRPRRINQKAARGIDAMTGSSNFDIAEAVWLKLLTDLADERPTIALLCKTSVARNVLEHALRRNLPIVDASLVRIDAKAWFGASVEACLLCLTLVAESEPVTLTRIPVFDALDSHEPRGFMGFAHGRIVADLDAYASFLPFDGTCPITWRQGVKHDAADVMELSQDPLGALRNKGGESLEIEAEHVYPLLKGSDLSRPSPITVNRRVIVTQRALGDDTERLNDQAPKLWSYLHAHIDRFTRRKSSIYRGRPRFAMFGIGPYSFAPYKVAVSGLHRRPVFHTVGPDAGRPVMLDDTCYFLACRSPVQAALVATLLNGPDAQGLLGALALPGAKRAVTKALLQRLDLRALLDHADRPSLLALAGKEVARLCGRPPLWPVPLESIFDPEPHAIPA